MSAPSPWPSKHRPPAGVIFDWDGLLMDTESAWTHAKAAVFETRGFRLGREHVEMTFGLHPRDSARVLAPFVGEEDPGVIFRELVGTAQQRVGSGVNRMPGAVEFVSLVSSMVPCGVASNSPKVVLEEGVQQSGFASAFDVVLSADDVARPKPAPDLYRLAAELLGKAPGEVLVLEDSAHGARAASAAGAHVVGVSRRGLLPKRRDDPDGLGVDVQVETLTDPMLLEWVRSWEQ